ncbi:putative short chain dehydrogenase protein [Eutypa lata UCREL1]|uniref:Putative short chain dehydrogenase protein n=1 Tax=Eutypa lata (strain UCR-EL1) TaxID=1287681 RepID=M7T4I8_EUTLA|nr:putative short chain dehydrogenase protein [Eutypa lata UCREL1]
MDDVGSLLIAQLKEAGSRIIEIDYSDTATIESSATELKAQNITIDVLINCGGTKVHPFEWHAHEFDDIMERFAVMVAVRLRY